MDVDQAFGKVLGRQPSEVERARLYRVRDTLGLQDNDAFWYIVMILEHYDALYRDYPRLIGEHTTASLEAARRAFAAAAEAESAKAHRTLSERVAETSVAIAKRLAERPFDLHRVTTALAAVVLFGAMCAAAGARLASGPPPWWAATGADGRARQAVELVLGAPAGWMTFALLLPGAFVAGRWGWRMAREQGASAAGNALGWTILLLSTLGALGCAVLLARTIG